jgi:hypothetical protein
MSNFAAITLLDGFALIRQAVFRGICRKEQGDNSGVVGQVLRRPLGTDYLAA